MRLSAILAATAGLLGLAGVSHAGQIHSPSIYASPQQTTAECTIGNVGSTPISVTVNIVDESGNPVHTPTTCARIEPHFLCEIFANGISPGAAYACSATTTASTTQLRGTMILTGADRLPLRSAALR